MYKNDLSIGLIGCGRIAFEAHLPAYNKYKKKVVSVCDIDLDKAKKASEQYNIAHYCQNYLDLAKLENVELIDIATRPHGRIELIESLLSFNKPLLIQKPLSYNYKEAFKFYNSIKNKNILIAVNHNARWAPVSREITQYINENKIGKLYSIHHVNRFNEDIDRWYTRIPEYIFLDHGLHYIDLVRWYTKMMPKYISATVSYKPDQISLSPIGYNINMIFPKEKQLSISLYFNNAVPAPWSFDCHWYIDGNKGSIHATIDSFSFNSIDGKEIKSISRLEGDWVPEGFLGAYQEFVYAINNKEQIPHSLGDHIKTLYLANLASESAKNNGEWKEVKRSEYEC